MKAKISLLLLILLVLVPIIMADSIDLEDKISTKTETQKIVFASKRDGNFEIYTIYEDGTGLKRLTNSKNDDLIPQWSPDGSKILYLSKKGKEFAIRVMNNDGSRQIELVRNCNSDFMPSWSSDSTKVLYIAKTKSKNVICTVDTDGNINRITEHDAEGANPSWFPDGSRILFIEKYRKNTYIYSVKSDGTDRIKITKDSGDYQVPTWSPDGQKIAYVSIKRKLTGTYNQIFIMNADGTNNIELADGSKKVEDIDYNDSLYWSPDGNYIAFTKVSEIDARMSEKGSITYSYTYGNFIISPSGNDYDRLLGKIGAKQIAPGWSADSSKIAFISNSRLMIFNMKTKIDDEIRVNVSIPLSPVSWSPDGSKLIFAGKNSSFQKSTLYMVSLDGKVTVLSDENDYDPVWAPNVN